MLKHKTLVTECTLSEVFGHPLTDPIEAPFQSVIRSCGSFAFSWKLPACSSWEIGFYPVQVLGRVVFSVYGCQTPTQHWIKILPPWVQDCSGQIIGQSRKRECRQNVRKMSKNCPKNVQKLSGGLKTQFSDIFWTIFAYLVDALFGDPVQCSPVTSPGILSSIGVGVWRKAPETFPDSNTTLDTFRSLS